MLLLQSDSEDERIKQEAIKKQEEEELERKRQEEEAAEKVREEQEKKKAKREEREKMMLEITEREGFKTLRGLVEAFSRSSIPEQVQESDHPNYWVKQVMSRPMRVTDQMVDHHAKIFIIGSFVLLLISFVTQEASGFIDVRETGRRDFLQFNLPEVIDNDKAYLMNQFIDQNELDKIQQ